MPLTKTVPVPSEPDNELTTCDQRLWIGNLDSTISEYNLLKLLQKYGKIEKFDMLFHRSGLPRGYAFVSYTSKETAEKVRELLDGKKIGSKRIAVRWAHSMTKDEKKKSAELFQISALTGAKSEKKASRSKTIQAIEAKLKMMEHNSSMEFELNINPSTSGNTSLSNNNFNTSHKKICNDNPLRDKHKQKPYEKINNK